MDPPQERWQGAEDFLRMKVLLGGTYPKKGTNFHKIIPFFKSGLGQSICDTSFNTHYYGREVAVFDSIPRRADFDEDSGKQSRKLDDWKKLKSAGEQYRMVSAAALGRPCKLVPFMFMSK